MEQLAQAQQEYCASKINLQKKKDKLYSDGKMDKWGLEVKLAVKPSKDEAMKIMLPKETRELTLNR